MPSDAHTPSSHPTAGSSPESSLAANPAASPKRLHLDRAKQLEVTWGDGQESVYSLSFLRSNCPCASCRKFREEQVSRKSLLNILPGNYSGEVRAVKAEMVGNYALRIDWSDDHGSGIYSFEYLYGIRPGV